MPRRPSLRPANRQVALLIDDRLDCVLAAREQVLPSTACMLARATSPSRSAANFWPRCIVGLSARCEEMLEYVKTADMSLVDYLGVGPLHETETKRDCGRAADGPSSPRALRTWPPPCGKLVPHCGGRRRQDGRSAATQVHRRRRLLCGERRLQRRRPLRRSRGARRYLAAGIGIGRTADSQPHIFNSGKRIPVLTSIPGCAFRRVHGSLPYPARYDSNAGKVASASRRPIW